MRTRNANFLTMLMFVALVAMLGTLPPATTAQERLSTMPGYEQYQKMSGRAAGAVKSGWVEVTWQDGGKTFEYDLDGKRFRYDIAAGTAEDIGKAKGGAAGKGMGKGKGGKKGGGGDDDDEEGILQTGPTPLAVAQKGAARGRQAASATSPDGKRRAYYKDYNLWLSDTVANSDMPITTGGNPKGRIKFGIASWVYGEELSQTTAMWWSPDGKKIAFFRIDESKVPDYFLPLNQSQLRPKIDAEAYPKPGDPNPIVDLFVYDLGSKATVQIDARDGKPFEDAVVGHYVYHISWSPDGKELFMHRMNRRQNILEFAAADPVTGKCRVIVHEEWLPSWLHKVPPLKYLQDKNRFLWVSERNGFKNFYLYNLSGQLLATITNHPFEVANIVRVDEKAGLLYYMARSGDNHMKMQLHRVGLDGKGDQRLTDPAWNHSVDLAPDGKHFIDVIQTHDTPPATRLVDAEGKVLKDLAKGDLTNFEKLGFKRVELFTYKAGDGVTELHGLLHFPSNFDPNKKYPLLVNVYGGPNTNKASENFKTPNGNTEYGFLFAELDSRSASGRGKQFTDAIYLKLGVTEIDDQAAGVVALWNRQYLDKKRVGIYGSSYGGYASAMCILRHPDVFQAASASSPVTDWRHYDSIYTERYMWIPSENQAGYDAGSAMKYANKLKGRLMLYYGTEDNNVHPSNTLALVKALQGAKKSFELQIGPDKGHTGLAPGRMMEFFIENLVMRQ